MSTVKTFIIEFKSGRRDRVFAKDIQDLKTMCNYELVVRIEEVM